jgi:rhamnogalacturonan endolyase
MKSKVSVPFLVLFLQLLSVAQAQVPKQPNNNNAAAGTDAEPYKKGQLLFKDDFDAGLENWIAEAPATPGSKVTVEEGKLLMDVDGGATVWLNKKLSGNILIEYKRKVIVGNGRNDRLSDLNQFWMASDPENKNLFTRTGVFSEYDSLQLYYAGFGGNTNTTTRFRKYTGNGDRVLYEDLTDKEHLLEPNKAYAIKIVVYNGLTKFFVDDKEFFSFQDPDPLQEGYFGFRTVQSRQEIDDFRVYKLE